MRHRRRALVCAVLLGSAGCPQPRQAPEPSAAMPCDRHEDCNCGADCGALDACVDGYCAQGQALLVPCRAGQERRPDDCRAASSKP